MKGVEKVTNEIIFALLAIGGLIVIILFFINYFIQSNAIIKTSDVDRHAIVLGNLFLSSDTITYSVDKTLYRGILSKQKLDSIMINPLNLGTYQNIFSNSQLFKQISYPDTVVFLTVTDLQTNDRWFLVGVGSVQAQGFSANEFAACLSTKLKLDPQTVARILLATTSQAGSQIPVLWDQYDFKECESSTLQFGYSLKTFPLAIAISGNEIHEGRLDVGLREA